MDIEEAKRASLGQVLFKCARLFNEQALERLRERTGLPLRAAHTALLDDPQAAELRPLYRWMCSAAPQLTHVMAAR